MEKNKTNTKDAIVDIAKSLENVFKKYSKNTREKAWNKITSKDGEKEIKKIIVDPTRSINTFQKLATQKDESYKFSNWLQIREEKENWIQNAIKNPGSLTRAAKKKKKSIGSYCQNPPSSKSERKCNFWKT